MSPPSRSDGTTYLIETRDDSEEYVISTFEKYYGDLLTDVVRNPADCDGVLLITTSHELPPDAFQRYVEVDAVVQTDIAIRDWTSEGVADSCAEVISDVLDGTAVSLSVNIWSTTSGGDEVRRLCEDALRATGLVVDESGSGERGIRVDIVGDWAGISLNR
ncbi:hypothetical protein [Haloarcula rubripromontorii]|uniref:hypothetical protein n=1 Tax=Haloarcula rubripromontorii TaxID=1705562 RepID=UPI00345B9C33